MSHKCRNRLRRVQFIDRRLGLLSIRTCKMPPAGGTCSQLSSAWTCFKETLNNELHWKACSRWRRLWTSSPGGKHLTCPKTTVSYEGVDVWKYGSRISFYSEILISLIRIIHLYSPQMVADKHRQNCWYNNWNCWYQQFELVISVFLNKS